MSIGKINRLVGRAMHDYEMLAHGDRVLVAVSGGVDSLVLAWLLDHWRRKAPIAYEVFAVHIDPGFGGEEPGLVQAQLKQLGIPHRIEHTDFGAQAVAAARNGCYQCARRRRNRLFEIAGAEHFTKLALGHHQEDLIETFFLNMFYSGNLSTMVPRQDLFQGELAIIRPLAYLTKDQIRQLAARRAIAPVANPCPLSSSTKRQTVRSLLDGLYKDDPGLRANLFAALANSKPDYLLTKTPGSGA